MPRTRKLIGGRGTTFRGFSPDPLCCPARASILTGQLAHNHGVLSNDAPHGGFQALPRRRSLAVWLERAGYHTVFMGKFLNGIEDVDGRRQPGWRSWHALAGGTHNYWSFWVNHGDGPQRHDAYQTDYFSTLAVRVIHRLADGSRPFFLWQSYLAPHRRFDGTEWAPPSPAPRHTDQFAQEPLVTRSSPAFNERDVRDKPPWLRQLPLLDRSDVAALTRLHRQRIRSMQAVDQGVARMIRALRREGELRNTLVIFMSDNGLLLGEHRFDAKNVAFDPATRIPLVIRGPGLPVGRRTASIGTSVDVAATIVRAARAVPPVVLDGRDLRDVAPERTPSLDTLLIQAGTTRVVQDAPR
jgi:arylsulfatase A-like enzyme